MSEIDSISEIQDWLMTQKAEDPIESKAEDRVTRAIAQNIKENKPLPQGRCNLCGKETDKLIPIAIKACVGCCNKFIQRGGQLRVIKKEIIDYHCDWCMARTFSAFYINPLACNSCTKKMGNRHKYEMKDVNQEREIINQEKRKLGVKA